MKGFQATLERTSSRLNWVFVRIPFDVSKIWGTRGHLRVKGEINGFEFRASLFPMGDGHHALLVTKKMQAGGKVGVGTVFGLAIFAVAVLGIVVFTAVAATKSVLLMGMVIFVFVMLALVLALVSSALSGIYSAAVYRYAAEGKLSEHFSRELVTEAFHSKSA